jgi:hypothetical protein
MCITCQPLNRRRITDVANLVTTVDRLAFFRAAGLSLAGPGPYIRLNRLTCVRCNSAIHERGRADRSAAGSSRHRRHDSVIYGWACTYAALGRAALTVEVFRDLDRAGAAAHEPQNGGCSVFVLSQVSARQGSRCLRRNVLP